MELEFSKCIFPLKNLQELHESACSQAFCFQPLAEFEKYLKKEEAHNAVRQVCSTEMMVRNFLSILSIYLSNFYNVSQTKQQSLDCEQKQSLLIIEKVEQKKQNVDSFNI